MSNISNTKIITITRGDTFSFPFTINVGSELYPQRYILSENSKLYLGVMFPLYLGVVSPNCNFENAIIKKVFTADSEMNKDGDIIITFNPEDTICLNQAKYYYEIKLQIIVDGKEEIYTVQQRQEFWIIE